MSSLAVFLQVLVVLQLSAAQVLPALNLDASSVSISGISSGAAMAVQMQVAYSASIIGAGVIAGVPYGCAQGSHETAITTCMKTPQNIDLNSLILSATEAANLGMIDPLDNLAKRQVWIAHGTGDTVVKPLMSNLTQDFFTSYMSLVDVHLQFVPTAEHAWLTDQYGSACSYLGFPFINNCDLDSAGEIFRLLYGPLSKRGARHSRPLFNFSQQLYTPGQQQPADISLGDRGLLYVPPACAAGSDGAARCRLHVFLHGCKTDLDVAGESFFQQSSLNEWAENNNIVVLYPQTAPSEDYPHNPFGCWDWWGYTGSNYATRGGPQMLSIWNMVTALTATAQAPGAGGSQ